MSIVAGLGSSTGMIAGGAATLAVVAVVTAVVIKTNNADNAPFAADMPASISTPNDDILTASVLKTSEPGGEAAPKSTTETSSLASQPVAKGKDITTGGNTDLNVSATVIGDTLVASTDPGETVAVSTSSAEAPKVSTQSVSLGQKSALRFDLVRVDKEGAAVVAGKAKPGFHVEIYLDGKVIVETIADRKGSFVALFDIPASENPRLITMAMRDEEGNVHPSSDRVLVAGVKVITDVANTDAKAVSSMDVSSGKVAAEEEAPPQVIIASDEGVKIVQPAAVSQEPPEVMANVSLDLITYDTEGEVVLTGRGQAGNHVRVYVNDKPVKTEPVDDTGDWQLSLEEVDAGVYTLRVDEIDQKGQVTSRLETPFQKEEPEAVKRVASANALEVSQTPDQNLAPSRVTIQPGATLWALAEARYGQGNLYMQIFEANRDNIRDPDLIYPGQIFEIPR